MKSYHLSVAFLWTITWAWQALLVNAAQNISPSDFATLIQNANKVTIEDSPANANTINSWNTKFSNGKWSDINYTAGCKAQRASWPAQTHWQRIKAMASLWYQDSSESSLLTTINEAMDYWFKNDYTNEACTNSGGTGGCPCNTPGLWNPNWYDQVILIPQFVSNVCLLLFEKSKITDATITSGCKRIMGRAYSFTSSTKMTGSNLLDVASVGLSYGLFLNDASIVFNSTNAFYSEIEIQTRPTDGIMPDGSFMQHIMQLYTGNYGNDFINQVISMFMITNGTPAGPPVDVENAFVTLMNGTEWMIIRNSGNTDTPPLLYEYSTIGRMVSHSEGRSVSLNWNSLKSVTSTWSQKNVINAIVNRVQSKVTSANQGPLNGVRSFYNADYMVSRGNGYVVTLKMFSTRTSTTECVNSQNPYGFHLSDGSIFTYLNGSEYIDIFPVWDWEKIPGTTVDIGGMKLECVDHNRLKGLSPFVGGVTYNNTIGMSVMNYTNPSTKALSWSKTVFFFPNLYAVQLSDIQATKPGANVVTTLDQRLYNGAMWAGQSGTTNKITGNTFSGSANKLWHDNVGFTFPDSVTLNVNAGTLTGNWSDIGVGSGTVSKSVFTATISSKENAYSYIAQLNINQNTFSAQSQSPVQVVTSTKPKVHAAQYGNVVSLAFWSAGTYQTPWGVTVTTNQPILVVIDKTLSRLYKVSVSDPTQMLSSVQLSISSSGGSATNTINLPKNTGKGSTITQTFALIPPN